MVEAWLSKNENPSVAGAAFIGMVYAKMEPAFESLRSDLTRTDGSVSACAAKLLPIRKNGGKNDAKL